MQLPTTGYGDQARDFNAMVRQQGHGVTVVGREWLSFGPTWIRFRLDGRTRRITWPQFHAGTWS